MGKARYARRYNGREKSSLKTIERRPIRPLERQRMRPWLVDLLDKGSCCQLTWLNKREKKFRVAWKHAAGQNWDMGMDACLFEQWARHTGKYYDGDKPNPKKWKANFRCALNSLPDVEQDRSLGIKRGLNAFKVYRFLDEKKPRPKPKQSGRRYNNDDDYEEDEDEFEDEPEWKPVPRAQRCRRARLALDSEGSEASSSPSHDGSDSEFSDGRLDTEPMLQVVKGRPYSPTPSPLPHFDQICPLQLKENLPSFSDSRFTDAHSPQTVSEDDNTSTTSSAPTDEEVVEMILQEDPEVLNAILFNETPNAACRTGTSDLPLVFYTDDVEEGPSVIVQSTIDACTQDWEYTAMEQL